MRAVVCVTAVILALVYVYMYTHAFGMTAVFEGQLLEFEIKTKGP